MKQGDTNAASVRADAHELADQLSSEQKSTVLVEVSEIIPFLTIRIRELLSQNAPHPDPQEHPLAPSWCVCGNCRDRHTNDLSRKCCGLKTKCLSQSRAFASLCLDEMIVSTVRAVNMDILGRRKHPIKDVNRSLRYTAYKQYIFLNMGIWVGTTARLCLLLRFVHYRYLARQLWLI